MKRGRGDGGIYTVLLKFSERTSSLKVLKENGFTDLKWLWLVVYQFVYVLTGRVC